MQAIVQDRYGAADVLERRDIDRPEIADSEVLVRVPFHGAQEHQQSPADPARAPAVDRNLGS